VQFALATLQVPPQMILLSLAWYVIMVWPESAVGRDVWREVAVGGGDNGFVEGDGDASVEGVGDAFVGDVDGDFAGDVVGDFVGGGGGGSKWLVVCLASVVVTSMIPVQVCPIGQQPISPSIRTQLAVGSQQPPSLQQFHPF